MKTILDGRINVGTNFKKYRPNYYVFSELLVVPSIVEGDEDDLYDFIDGMGATFCAMTNDKNTCMCVDKKGKDTNYLSKIIAYLQGKSYTVDIKEQILYFHDNRRYKQM